MTHTPIAREIVRLGASNIVADWNHLFRGGIALDPNPGAFGDPPKNDPPPANDPPKNDPPSDDKKPTDAEAKLLKEVMGQKTEIASLREKLAAFGEIDPAAVKALINEKKASDEAKAKAEAEKREAEKKAAEAAGDVDRVKAMMAEEHQKELSTVQSKLADLQKAISGKETVINELTVGQQFSNSHFIQEELVLTPAKARVVYGAHFEFENGKVVGYDKPKGEVGRTALIDARGEPLPFESALKKLIEADPDRDHVLKAKTEPGAGSKPGSSKARTEEAPVEGSGLSRIKAALSKSNFSFKK